MADLDELERLHAAASAGEWESGTRQVWPKDGPDRGSDVTARDANRVAIVALHNAAPALIAAARERDRLRRHYDAAGPEHNLLALLDLYDERRREAAREVERLQAVIRTGGAMLRAERSALGVPVGVEPDEVERLRALCREAANALRAIDSALECECVCDCASDEQEHEPECQRCAACTVDDALPARLRARLRAAGGGT